MRTFLGGPILRTVRRYGNLYLTEKAGAAPFDDTDEALVTALAAFAAGAIEPAELLTRERSRDEREEHAPHRRELHGATLDDTESERYRHSHDSYTHVCPELTPSRIAAVAVEGARDP